MKVYKVYKKIGETPLEALEKFRKKNKISPAAKLTYAGRLDPMASGVLLILEGATQEDREKYMGLDKEYEVEVLFGFETDTYDLLGLPIVPPSRRKEGSLNTIKEIKGFLAKARNGENDLLNLSELIKNYHGVVKLPIPPYSSVPYKGKPLFEWARSGKLKEKDLPLREFKVKSIKLKGIKWVKGEKIWKYIENNLKKVKGDFRQEKILKVWEKALCHPGIFQGNEKYPGSRTRKKLDSGSRVHSAGMTQPQYPYSASNFAKASSDKKASKGWLISNILILCSSGTYIRSIAHDLGKKLKTGAVVFSLERTKVGKYRI